MVDKLRRIPEQVPPTKIEEVLPTLRKEAVDDSREALYTPGEVAGISVAINSRDRDKRIKAAVNQTLQETRKTQVEE